MVKAFESMGLKEEQRHTIWSVVSGVLLLGNVATVGKSASRSHLLCGVVSPTAVFNMIRVAEQACGGSTVEFLTATCCVDLCW